MKERTQMWFMFPALVLLAIITQISLNYDIIMLKEEIINYTPYPDNIGCLGCCSLECLEHALQNTIKMMIILPFFIVGLFIVLIIIIGLLYYLDISLENEGGSS